MTLKFKILHEDAAIPRRHSAEAAGFDIQCLETFVIYPEQTIAVSTGVAVAVPAGCVGLVKDRSSMSLRGLVTRAGVIDSDYRGELKVVLHNESSGTVRVDQGTRVAQLIVLPVSTVPGVEVYTLGDTERGAGGFGSTGPS